MKLFVNDTYEIIQGTPLTKLTLSLKNAWVPNYYFDCSKITNDCPERRDALLLKIFWRSRTLNEEKNEAKETKKRFN